MAPNREFIKPSREFAASSRELPAGLSRSFLHSGCGHGLILSCSSENQRRQTPWMRGANGRRVSRGRFSNIIYFRDLRKTAKRSEGWRVLRTGRTPTGRERSCLPLRSLKFVLPSPAMPRSVQLQAFRESPCVSRDYRHPGAGQYRLRPDKNRSAPRSIRARSGRDWPFYARNRSANRSNSFSCTR